MQDGSSAGCTCAATTPTCNTASTASLFPSRSQASARRSTRASPTASTCSRARCPRSTATAPRAWSTSIPRASITESGGSLGFLGGSHSHQQTDGELYGTNGGFNYYLTGSYLQNDLGIENPTPEKNAIHDHTRQSKGFGQLSYVIDAASRVSFTFGSADNKFQIPNVPGQDPAFMLAGAPPIDSAQLDARQNEKNIFQVLSYQRSLGQDVDYQVSLFHRYTDVSYHPDPVGDLVFNGVAAQILRRNVADGTQGDMSWRANDKHTVRAGFFASRERFNADNSSQVFPADEEGNQAMRCPDLDPGRQQDRSARSYGLYPAGRVGAGGEPHA